MMSLESLFGSSVGLEIGADAIRVVQLIRRFGRIRLGAFGMETVDRSLPEDDAVVQSIQRLFLRLKIKPKEAVLHVDGKGVRVLHLHAPPLSSGELIHWLRDAFSKRFHATVQAARFAVSFHVIGRDDKGYEVAAAFCQMQELDKRLEWAERAGLVPTAVGAGMLDAASAFASGESNFFDRTLAFVLTEGDSAQVVVTDKGNPVWQQSIGKAAAGKLLSDWQTESKKRIEKVILLFGQEAGGMAEAIRRSGFETEIGSPLSGVLSRFKKLSPEYALAAGLALKRFFPLLNTIDLLPESQKQIAQQQGDKQKAVHFILYGGATVLACLLLLNVVKMMLAAKLERQDGAMLAMGDRIVQMDLTKKEAANLEKRLLEIERLGNRRSLFAEMLQEIGIGMPPSVWLEKIVVQPSEPVSPKQASVEPNAVLIQGWALDEEKAAALLSKLESVSFLDRVRLVKTERVPADEVWQMSKTKKMDLVRFQIAGALKTVYAQ